MIRWQCFPSQNRVRTLLALELLCIIIYGITAVLYLQYEAGDILSIQENPNIISAIKRLLLSPSKLPYNISDYNIIRRNGDSYTILKHLFPGKRKGTFVEAGAFNGKDFSTTLELEREWGWSGVLVEPSRNQHKHIQQLNRKSTIFKGCLSVTIQPMMMNFLDMSVDSYIDFDESEACKNNPIECHTEPVWCVPLYSLLLATNLTSLDFLSLHTSGSELHILNALPFFAVDFKVIRVNIHLLSGWKKRVLSNLLKSEGYRKLISFRKISIEEKLTPGDVWFVHNTFPVSNDFQL